jgi:NAD(P)-dependent dehydrogenase (short-subunit alcohol dehydrogenase family)
LPYFFDRGGRGVILNVSSIFGRVPMPWAASYSASKAGLAGFTEALRFELASRFGIDVCGVYPAYVDTPTYRNSANYTLELYVRLSVVGVHLSTVPDGGLGEAPTPRRRIAILRELRHETVRKGVRATIRARIWTVYRSQYGQIGTSWGPRLGRLWDFSDSFMTEL